MALETTSASQSALIHSEIISRGSVAANLPANPLFGLAHRDSIDGLGSGTKNYTVESDLGVSSGGSESVRATNTLALTYGSSVAATPTEGVLERIEITEDAVMRRLGGMPHDSMLSTFQNGSDEQIQAILAPDVRRVTARAMRKIHRDGLEKLGGFSTTSGTSGADIALLNLLQARYKLKKNSPHLPPSRWAYVLSTNQTFEIEQEISGNSFAGSLWNQQGDLSFINKPGDEWSMNGLVNTFLRHPVYEVNESEVTTANAGADVVGALMCVPASIETSPDDASLGGKVGALCLLMRHWLKWRWHYDADARAMVGVMNAKYVWVELADLNGSALVTDAP